MQCKILVFSSLALLLSSCVPKPIIEPYSKVVEEAQNRGVEIANAEQEREKFFKSDQEHNERLITLISKRAEDTVEDLEYRIGPSDEITISVFDVPELNLVTQVKEDGTLSLPLLGVIKAQGLTEPELLDQVTQRLKSFVINPQVSLFISVYGSHKVAVIGAVKTPASYPLKKGKNNILELISEAGGLTDRAGNTLSFVPAEAAGNINTSDAVARARFALAMDGPATEQASGIEVYLDNVMGTSGGIPVDIPVRGGDMIIIPEAGKVMVDGEVQKVGVYELGRQASLLGSLAAAGGITYGAKVDEVEILRDNGNNNRSRLVVDLTKISSGEERDYKLRNGDIVKVPSDSGRRMRQDTFDGITRIINFGVGGSVNLGP